MLGKRFIGSVYVDGEIFTHPNNLMGTAEITRNSTLSKLCKNINGTLTNSYLDCHNIELRVYDRQTKQVESIRMKMI